VSLPKLYCEYAQSTPRSLLSDGAEPADAMSTMACRNGTTDGSFIKLFSVGNSLLSHVCATVSLDRDAGGLSTICSQPLQMCWGQGPRV